MSYENHHDWLSLIEISGPFLAVPVLKESFPQGLEELDASKRKRLRQAYEEWREALELEDEQFAELHVAWIDEVLSRGLELDEDGKGDVLKRAEWCAANLKANLPEHGVTLSPDLAVVDEQRANKPLLLIQTYAQHIDLDATLKQDGWAATPADRMVALCRSLGCRLGLVTNGERWMLVDAPVGAVTTFASWYARIWSQEPITLQAFVHLLGIRRFFVDESEQLPALFDRSLKFQDEVTDALGEQVRRAVEVLIQTLDKADQDRDRELLHDVKESELYEAALTVMMRLVFLLSAEECGLLLMGDERYEANYALSTLRMQLRKESEEILERRWDAWSRLLAIFRAVFGGIEHENLRLPALGGSLFDPDRFPFLEGRAKGSNWRSDAAKPLPIDNRTVLLLLEAIQQFQGRTLSYRALDVEQIGYVYEGLLERTVKRINEVTLELDATKSAKKPWVTLAELDSAGLDGAAQLAALLKERTGSSASRVRNDLAKPVDDTLADRLLTACQGDTRLRDRVKPYAQLLRTDPWGYPLVYPAGAFIVTTGSDRRETGTHYTPKSLTEAIVAETLTPVAYVGPAEGALRDKWVLKSPAELLDLKICDPAMGSGAFLVQACRWLSDRLVESWALAEASGNTVSVDGEVLEAGAAKEPLPSDSEARTVIARRLIAECCLYGVDINPLAVELAKLSIWLVTLAKERPFGFLDHNLRSGDSLLGLHRLDQLTKFSLQPEKKQTTSLFASNIDAAVKDAILLRKQLRQTPIRDIRDVQNMERLDQEARQKLEHIEHVADAMIGEALVTGASNQVFDAAMDNLSNLAAEYFEGNEQAGKKIIDSARMSLSFELPDGKPIRKPFHWALQFPEVIERGGFDSFIGNPPFLWALRISIRISIPFSHFLKRQWPHAKKNADLCSYFILRAAELLKATSPMGFVTTNSISEADTKETTLDYLTAKGFSIYSANSEVVWPGAANVRVSNIFIFKGSWKGRYTLDGTEVPQISTSLEPYESLESVNVLQRNKLKCFKGSVPLGDGFFISDETEEQLITSSEYYKDVIFPFINGQELNSSPVLAPGRKIIYFWNWSLKECEEYPLALEIVRKNVKPERDKIVPKNNMAKQRRDLWWKFTGPTVDLYESINGLKQVLVASAVSKHHMFAFLPSNYIYSNALNVFAFEDFSVFALLQSSLHHAWSLFNGSKLEDRPRYNVSDCFETFPFPKSMVGLEEIGRKYYDHRSNVQTLREIGLTDLYNLFHSIEILEADVELLRNLHVQMDKAVASVYGWDDIDFDHGFHEAKQGIRFSISEKARRDVIQRLLKLNVERFEEELAEGLHIKTKSARQRKVRRNNIQPGFDFGRVDK